MHVSVAAVLGTGWTLLLSRLFFQGSHVQFVIQLSLWWGFMKSLILLFQNSSKMLITTFNTSTVVLFFKKYCPLYTCSGYHCPLTARRSWVKFLGWLRAPFYVELACAPGFVPQPEHSHSYMWVQMVLCRPCIALVLCPGWTLPCAQRSANG